MLCFLYNFCVKHFAFYKELSETPQMYIGLHGKDPSFLSGFDETWIFSTDFPKNTNTWNFMKIRPVEADLFRAEGRS